MALHAHPGIVCHDELFSRDFVHGYRPKESLEPQAANGVLATQLLEERSSDPEKFLFERVFAVGPRLQVGFKVVYSDLFAGTETSQFLRSFLIESRIRVIHLRRLNMLRCFLSVERMRRLGITHSNQLGQKSCGRLHLDLRDFTRFIVSQDNNCDLVARSMNIIANPRYENLPQGYNKVLDALGVLRRPFVEHLARLSDQSLSELVEDVELFRPFDFPRLPGFAAYSD